MQFSGRRKFIFLLKFWKNYNNADNCSIGVVSGLLVAGSKAAASGHQVLFVQSIFFTGI